MQEANNGCLEVQEETVGIWSKQWISGGAEGVSGGAQGKEWVSGGTGGRLLAQDSEKNLCDDPFQTVPGSIPGSCIPAFTGTPWRLSSCLVIST